VQDKTRQDKTTGEKFHMCIRLVTIQQRDARTDESVKYYRVLHAMHADSHAIKTAIGDATCAL